LFDLVRNFKPTVYADGYEFRSIFTKLEKKGVPVKIIPFQGTPAHEMASALQDAINQRIISFYRCPTASGRPCQCGCSQLLTDLAALNPVEGPKGWLLKAERTKAGHADSAFALALALLAHRESPHGEA
jgi:hypothetical protein